MNFNKLVNIQELQIPISSDKAAEWVKTLLSRFHKSKKSRDYLWQIKGIVKEILDELRPLGKYATNYYSNPEIFLKYYPGSSTSYDADFINCDGDIIERVEVTMAIDGHQRSIQREYINDFGYSRVYQTPEYSGNIRKRQWKETEVAIINSDEIIKIHHEQIQEAYIKKHNNIQKYPDMTLLIGVDISLLVEWELQMIIDYFEVYENSFKSIKCVNVASDHCWVLK